MNPSKLTDEKRARFLAGLRETGGNVSKASVLACCSRTAVYELRERDPEFARAWDEVQESAIEELEQEARRRAFQGVEEPVYQKGQKVGVIQRYSDLLMIFLLKAHRPEKYREQKLTPIELDAAIERQFATLQAKAIPPKEENTGIPLIG